MESAGSPAVRKAWYAGTWYAAEPDNLRATITEAIEQARQQALERDREGPVRVAVLPHAGLTYSARGIAHLLRLATRPIRRVLILSPSHNSIVPDDTLSFGLFSGYDTPLGRLEAFRTGLERSGPDATIPIQREHAVEMVLPFLAYQQELQGQSIAVAMALISHVTEPSRAQALAREIADALGFGQDGGTLLIASSDFSHYGQRFGYAPFGTHVDPRVAARVREADLEIARHMAAGELGPLFLSQRVHRCTICGIAGAAIACALARQVSLTGWIADYYNSMDVLGSHAHDFVAYGTVLWR